MAEGKIFVTGDTHADIDSDKLFDTDFSKRLSKDDFVIVAGDFGYVWNGEEKEAANIKRLEELPFTLLFIDGNHENFDMLDAYPVETWHGGKVHRIGNGIIHLMRGQVFEICGKSIFTFGGADSTDKFMRTEGLSWWKQELPSEAEIEEGLSNLERAGWNIDYAITHTCPDHVLDMFAKRSKFRLRSDILTLYLERIFQRLNFRKWFLGHFHFDAELNDKITVVFNKMICLY